MLTVGMDIIFLKLLEGTYQLIQVLIVSVNVNFVILSI